MITRSVVVLTAASNDEGAAATIFWPATDDDGARIASVTATIELRPIAHVSLRLELRHDDANVDMLFDEDVDLEEPELGHRTQDTLTLAAIGWF